MHACVRATFALIVGQVRTALGARLVDVLRAVLAAERGLLVVAWLRAHLDALKVVAVLVVGDKPVDLARHLLLGQVGGHKPARRARPDTSHDHSVISSLNEDGKRSCGVRDRNPVLLR